MSYLHPSNGKPGPLRRIPRDGLTDQRGGFNPKREARPSQTMTALPGGKAGVYSFNPKRAARPSQTEARVLAARIQNGFNPKREARPSQTLRTSFFVAQTRGFNPKREARPSQTDPHPRRRAGAGVVSIPNGKPGPLRHKRFDIAPGLPDVSIPNGKPGPLRQKLPNGGEEDLSMFQSQTGSQALSDAALCAETVGQWQFQSQTGSQALSDEQRREPGRQAGHCFNPKREARPSQTTILAGVTTTPVPFQSQTGSQALSDIASPHWPMNTDSCFNPKREARPSQTI